MQPTKTPVFSARHMARIAVVQALYMKEQIDATPASIAHQFKEHHLFHVPTQMSTEVEPDHAYFEKLIKSIPDVMEEIDEKIADYLSEQWTVAKLPSVMRNLLRSGVYELMYEPLVPTPVVINEYVELGRSFVTEKDVKFINGLLDKVSKIVRRPA